MTRIFQCRRGGSVDKAFDGLPVLVLTEEVPTVSPAGPSVLSELLGIWEDELRSRDFPFTDATSAGLPPDEIKERLQDAGHEPAEELVVWFAWRDGQPMLNDTPP